MALTDLFIKNLKLTGKTQKHFDGRGLFIEITPQGSKLWRHKYYFQGKEKLLSLGRYPDVRLAEAKEILSEQKKLLAKGIDPSAIRQALEVSRVAAQLNQFEVVARAWFTTKQSSWSDSHAKVVMQRLEAYVFPYLGATAIESITAQDILSLLKRLVDKGTIETANRVKSIISQVFRYATTTNQVTHDVAAALVLPSHKVKHHAAILDPKRLGQVLRMFDSYEGGVVVRCALRLTPLLFVRPGELRAMRWSDIDMETREWRFILSKTKQKHIVPLADQSIAILKEIKIFTGAGQFVFPSPRTPNRPMSDGAVTAALRAMGFSGNELTAHGFRAVARTLIDEELGYRPEYIEHQLGHNVKDPLGRAYNRTKHLKERREMMQAWADYLDKLKGEV